MQYRNLGRTGLKVSVISLGSWLTYGGHVGNGKDHSLLSIRLERLLTSPKKLPSIV
jgi:aryl-alcohol dehydrogenase-like predicted oxidoreductase